jgi:hypothetical protein
MHHESAIRVQHQARTLPKKAYEREEKCGVEGSGEGAVGPQASIAVHFVREAQRSPSQAKRRPPEQLDRGYRAAARSLK